MAGCTRTASQGRRPTNQAEVGEGTRLRSSATRGTIDGKLGPGSSRPHEARCDRPNRPLFPQSRGQGHSHPRRHSDQPRCGQTGGTSIGPLGGTPICFRLARPDLPERLGLGDFTALTWWDDSHAFGETHADLARPDRLAWLSSGPYLGEAETKCASSLKGF